MKLHTKCCLSTLALALTIILAAALMQDLSGLSNTHDALTTIGVIMSALSLGALIVGPKPE